MTKSGAGWPHPRGPGTVLLKNVYHMLAYAFTALETDKHRRLAGEKFNHIHDLLAAILVEGLEPQHRRGSECDYESSEEDPAFVRGRIDPAAAMRLGARRSRRVRCRYDERTENTVVNRILKTVARRLLLHGDVTRRRRARLKSALLGTGNVEILSGEELRCLRWDTLPIHRGNRSYQLLVGASRLVLDKLLPSHVEGGLELADFLGPQVPSALYRRLVLTYFRRHHPGLCPVAPWASGGIENAPALLPGMYTDVVLTGPSRILIIDAKCHGRIPGAHHGYKILSAGNRNRICGYVMYEAHDLRQRGCEVEGMPLYAQTIVDPPLREMWIETGRRLYMRTLDLDQDFIGITNRFDEIVGLIKVA